MRNYISIILSIIIILNINSCQTKSTNDDLSGNIDMNNLDQNKDTTDVHKVKVIFKNVPSPVEMSNLLHRANLSFNQDLLNPLDKEGKYVSLNKIALTLGVYGADLSYVRIFDQLQQSIKYLSAVKKASQALGIPSDEGAFTVERLEENVSNRDSLLMIISETYETADAYLKENNRGSIAALIILGGWVEALHIATVLVQNDDRNDAILRRIAEQKLSINNLLDLLMDFEDNEAILLYIPKIKQLKEAYDKVEIDYEEKTILTDTIKKQTSINGDSEIIMSDEVLNEITKIISEIRAEVIK